MPEKVGFARGYMFTGILLATRPEGVHPPAWDFMVERIHAGAGDVAPPSDPYHVQFEQGEVLTLDDRCYPPRGLRIGKRYLISEAAIGEFSSQSTVVWEVRPHGRVRLLRQYGSEGMDPRFARPRTVAQVIALMTPRDELPPTDTAPASILREGDPSDTIRSVVAWLLRLLSIMVS